MSVKISLYILRICRSFSTVGFDLHANGYLVVIFFRDAAGYVLCHNLVAKIRDE